MAQRAEREELKLPEAAQTLLDECRMVLPGIQAIFGFQLIAVFNERFAKDVEPAAQCLHLAAMGLVALGMTLVMTPAAYHRQRELREVTADFIRLSSRLLLASMVPLALGLSLDVYLIAHLVLGRESLAISVGAALLAVMLFFWFVFPQLRRRSPV